MHCGNLAMWRYTQYSEIALPGYIRYIGEIEIGTVEVFSLMLRIILFVAYFHQLIIGKSLLFQFFYGPSKVFISLFYWPPNSSSQIFDNLFLYLQSLNVGSFCNYILLGDFNVNFCNQSHPFYSKLYSIFESFCLSQIVTDHTHLGPNGTTSMIDFITTSSPSLLQSCETIPPLANPDHTQQKRKYVFHT